MFCSVCGGDVHPVQDMNEHGRLVDQCPECRVPFGTPREPVGGSVMAPSASPAPRAPVRSVVATVEARNTLYELAAPLVAPKATTLAGRIEELKAELETIEVMMARRAGLRAELKQLEKAQKSRDSIAAPPVRLVGGLR